MDSETNTYLCIILIVGALFSSSVQANIECHVCPSTPALDRCPTMHCPANQMCFASTEMYNGVTLQHLAKCMNRKICTALMNATFNTYSSVSAHVGKRYADTICALCCGDDLCNSDACETIKQRMRSLKEDGHLDLYTLKEII